jgi:chemotaxis protein MotB
MKRSRWQPEKIEDKKQERWLLTYSDLITLLLILFVVFYAMSDIDDSRFETIAKALQFQFTSSDSPIPQGNAGQSKPPDATNSNPTTKPKPAEVEETELDLERLKAEERALQEALKTLQTYIKNNQLDQQITFKDTPRGIAITLKDLFLYDVGRADLKANAYPLLDELATVFAKVQNKISIEGHTDNQPLNTGSIYEDNWGLSNARSLSVLRYFIYEKDLSAKQLISTGFSDTVPIANNETAEGRAKNRRVEMVILR